MSELEIQENMSAEEAFMDTENAYEEIPEAFQKLAQLLGQDQFEVLFPDKDAKNQDEIRLVYLMNVNWTPCQGHSKFFRSIG